MPKEIVGLIFEYVAGYLLVGSMVDVKDQRDEWILGQIADMNDSMVKITYVGWLDWYGEWVTLDRVRPSGTMMTQIWLKEGNIVCLGEDGVYNPGLEDMLLAEVLEIRPDTATVLKVRLQVRPDIPLPFSLSGDPREPSEKELNGKRVVGLTDGSIFPYNVGGTE
jgi:hypothetical protein